MDDIFWFCQIVGWVLVLYLIFTWIKNTPDSACHGECNQGRNCTCKPKPKCDCGGH